MDVNTEKVIVYCLPLPIHVAYNNRRSEAKMEPGKGSEEMGVRKNLQPAKSFTSVYF